MNWIRAALLVLLACLLGSCSREGGAFRSVVSGDFEISFTNSEEVNAWLESKVLEGSDCELRSVEVAGSQALEISTSKEFSDAFVDLRRLFGSSIDLTQFRWVELELLVPETSWIAAMKFNVEDGEGNFGGFSEIVNNFPGSGGQWRRYVINTDEFLPDFQNWQGARSPLDSVSRLSFNPYCAHQLDASSVYVRRLAFSKKEPQPPEVKALLPYPSVLEDNSRFLMDFEDDEEFRRRVGYRVFESTKQAFKKGVGGRDSVALRLLGGDPHKYIAFLPEVGKITGKPVDFSKVKRLYFSYYLTEDSEAFETTWLYLTSDTWGDILIDHEFIAYDEFKRGEWVDVSIEISDLNLELAKGKPDVLERVEDIRIDFMYYEGRKDIEVWIDDFGWE